MASVSFRVSKMKCKRFSVNITKRWCVERFPKLSNIISNKQGSWTATLFSACLIYLISVVSATHYDGKNHVPKMNYSFLPSTSTTGTYPQSRHYAYSYHQQNQQYQPFKNSVAKAYPTSFYSTLTKLPSLFTSHSNDPRMGYFADSTSPTSASSPPLPMQTSLSRPRSLSSLTFATPTTSKAPSSNSSSPSTTSTTTTTTRAPAKSIDSKLKTKNTKRKIQKKAERKIDNEATTTTTALDHSSNMDLDAGTGRTFFITPLLAYLFPVFLAQMFGMGMIPAAALITLPIFLLPLGLTAAIFLI